MKAIAESEKTVSKQRRRIAIIFDGKRWHVRRIRVIEHDMERDEQVYRCDKPIASDLRNIVEAVRVVRPSWVHALGLSWNA